MPSEPPINGQGPGDQELTEAQLEQLFDQPTPVSGDTELFRYEGKMYVRTTLITINSKHKYWFTPDGALHFGRDMMRFGRQGQSGLILPT